MRGRTTDGWLSLLAAACGAAGDLGAGQPRRRDRRRARVGPLAALLLAGLLVAPRARAAEEPLGEVESAPRREPCCAGLFVLEGEYRFRTVLLDDFPIDDAGTAHGQEVWGEHRLRIRPWVSFADQVFLRAEADFFSGPIFGDTFDIPHGPAGDRILYPMDDYHGLRRVDPRALWLEWRAPFGRVLLGQMTSQWGLGVLANDGGSRTWRPEDDPVPFGDRHHGDIVERVAVAVAPAALFTDAAWARRLILVGAFDVVFRDENADLLAGDLAFQGIASLSYRGVSWRAGAYVVYRDQEDDAGTHLRATVVDLFGRWRIGFGDGMALTLAAEAVLLTGSTDRVQSERAREGLDLLGFGGVLRAAFDWPDTGLYPKLEVGFASGDNDRGDDTNRAFSFDPDHRVGLILFEQVLSRMSARAVERVSDPERRAVPPVGYEYLPTNGSVTNALYLFPTVTYRPLHWLSLRLGVLWAYAPADVVDPYAAAKRGGFNANYLGGTSGAGSLGVELDGGLDFLLKWEGLLELRVGAEGGVLFPGEALEGPGGDLGTPWTLRMGLDLTF
jgi:hypothetical protein